MIEIIKNNKLKKQHELIKNHPWRLNHEERFTKSFTKELDKLLDLFYEAGTNSSYFYHELSSNMWHLQNGYYSEGLHGTKDDKDIYFGELIKAIELGITTIHQYIVDGSFDSYYTYYTGCNHDKKEGRWSHFIKVNNKWKREGKKKEDTMVMYK